MLGSRAPGRVLDGRYRLEEVIGRGGMATVWRAEDVQLRRRVAVKEILLPVGPDADPVRARALREAHAAARVHDRGAVAVYDVIDEGDRLYLVLELVHAQSLADRVRTGGLLAPDLAAALGLSLCSTLAAAHDVGVIHRDVKPANVLLPADGGPRLTDFGIASVRDDPRLTTTGTVLGSPSYMSPEQASGRAATEATDLWGLGATLYFAVEGLSPFERDTTMATLRAVVDHAPRRAERAGPLEPLLLALLDKDPARRPPLTDVRRHLDAVAAGDPSATIVAPTAVAPAVVAPPSPQSVNAHASHERKSVHRRGFLAAVLGITLLAAALVVAAFAVDDGDGEGGTAATTTAVPVTWVTYTDPTTGYRVQHPEGWTVEAVTEGRTDFRDSQTGVLLRVEWTDEPGDDPVASWNDLSSQLARTREGYELLRIEPSGFKGLSAAEWEFTHVDSGVEMRTLDIGMVRDDLGFAVLFRAPAADWDALADVRQRILDSFTPPAPAPPPEDDKDDDEGRGNGNGDKGKNGGGDDD